MQIQSAFFDISIGGKAAGRIEMTLRMDVVPETAGNFLGLCTGKHPLYPGYCYKGSYFHRILPGACIQSGRLYEEVQDKESGTKMMQRRPFKLWKNENYTLQHNGPGVLSMANQGDECSQNSGFFICTANRETLKHWDGKHVVFGNVTKGMNVVSQIEKIGKQAMNPERSNQGIAVIITDCGQLKDEKKNED